MACGDHMRRLVVCGDDDTVNTSISHEINGILQRMVFCEGYNRRRPDAGKRRKKHGQLLKGRQQHLIAERHSLR